MELTTVACVALAYALPLLFMGYFPGLDLPWNAAIMEVLHQRGDASDFLAYFAVERSVASYPALSLGVDGLAVVVGDMLTATELVIVDYVIIFVMRAQSHPRRRR